MSLVLPSSLVPSHSVQAMASTSVIATSDTDTESVGMGGVYTCDLNSGICTRKVVMSYPDNVLCSGNSCLVARDPHMDGIIDVGGIYLCDLVSGTCSLKYAVPFASNVVCPTANNCIVSSDTFNGLGGGIYACDLAAGTWTGTWTCTRTSVTLDNIDFVACLSESSCIVTRDEDPPSNGIVYTCDLGTGVCNVAATLESGVSGLFCFSATSCIATIDFDLEDNGGVYACDLGTGTCAHKADLAYADFIWCTSETSCLVTKDDSVSSGGGIYACDLLAGACTLNALLDSASGIQASPSAPVGGLVEQVKLPNLLVGWTIALAALAVIPAVAFTYRRKRLTHQRKN